LIPLLVVIHSTSMVLRRMKRLAQVLSHSMVLR
jgi:hypothetical protein